MSLVYRKRANSPSLTHWIYDYLGEMKPFIRRIDRKLALVPLVLLKSVEWGIYRWYQTPIRRFYGVKGNELIYMITRRCAERCPKCGIWENPEPNSERLGLDHFLDCLRRLHENLYQVTLTGGEPMIFGDDLMLIAEESRKLDVPMVIVTSGALLTEKFLRRYDELRHVLVVSLDTVDPAKWQAFRGRDHFDLVMKNVALAREILGDRLRIQSVLALESADEVAGVAAFCRERGIRHTIQPYMDFGGVWCSLERPKVSDVPCAARKNICIYPNGDVVKCFDHRRIPIAREPLGNIGRQDIIEILCTRRATEVSRAMKTCNLPCKELSCNKPAVLLETALPGGFPTSS
jgi:MoaA/NifB/PqqE/SkfB family radical SAM enzyme